MDPQFLDPEFLQKLEYLFLMSRRLHRGRPRGEHQNYRKGASLEFYDYRNYQAGDDLRYIDWNIYSRLDKLFVKLFEAEEDLTIHLILDTSKSMGFGKPPKIEYAKQIAAALGYIGIASLDRVGITAFADKPRESLQPRRRRSQVFSLFDYLSRVKTEGTTGFNNSVSEYALRSRNPGLAVVISDLLDPSGYELGLQSLLYRKFDVILIQVLDPQEFSPPLEGVLKLVDQETEEERKITVDRGMLQAYRDKLGSFFSDIEKYSLQRGIEYLRTSTEIPFEQVVLNYLRQGVHLN